MQTFLMFIGAIVFLLVAFFLCYGVMALLCNPVPGNDTACRVTNRAKRELEQGLYTFMGSIVLGIVVLVFFGIYSLFGGTL